MNLHRRIERLEDQRNRDEEGPSLAERLNQALEVARGRALRRKQGLPCPEESITITGEGPIAERLRKAKACAKEMRPNVPDNVLPTLDQ
jgi:hypothetical protein